MPFTASHAAAVLPLRARWLSASALAIGAMAPDLPLFVPLPVTEHETHTVAAMLLGNTVVGLVLFVLWHGFLARPADWFAPSAVRRRLAPQQQPGLRRRLATPGQWAGVVASLYIGGVTHQFLDLFTHPGTVVTDRFPVFHTALLGMPAYYLLQVVTSVLGLVLLTAWALRWFRDADTYQLERQPSVLGKLAARFTVVLAPVAGAVLAAHAVWTAGGDAATLVFEVSAAAVAASLAAVVALATGWHVRAFALQVA
jgi:hypothetical protein